MAHRSPTLEESQMNHSVKTAIMLALASLPILSYASSHREAPFIAGMPKVDGTDLYLFRSYEPNRGAYVTLIANYVPFQDPGGGPNFYQLDANAVYSINVNNAGDGRANLSFQFQFTNTPKNLAVDAGGQQVAVPLLNIGPVDKSGKTLNVTQSYILTVERNYGAGGRNKAENETLGGTTFYKPVDNIGNKSIPDYAAYANNFIYELGIPGCATPGRVFVGQRKEGFVINVGEIFDLVNTNPVGRRDGEPNSLSYKNVTSIALEVPISCLTSGSDPVIGAWTTASLPSTQMGKIESYATTESIGGVEWVQVSRLANPLVNEIVIGLPDKDRFNSSNPLQDAQFLSYVTNPTLPVLLNTLFGAAAIPPGTPRNDLVAAFLTGVKGLNQPLKVQPAELMRLNTAIPPTAPASQNDLGVLGGDLAGFPNGRRPYDDVADIELRVVMGALCGKIGACGSETSDPNHGAPYTDGSRAAGADAALVKVTGQIKPGDTYLPAFPYLNTPLPGSPNGENGVAKN
jgi:Domain of unknown function (DUF4331)